MDDPSDAYLAREAKARINIDRQLAAAGDSTLHWSYLGQVNRGQRNLTLHNILRLAEVLGVDPGELVHGLRAPGNAGAPR